MKKDIKSILLEELKQEFLFNSIKKYRAEQVYKWLLDGINDFNDMNNLPKDLRKYLCDNYEIKKIGIENKLISKIDGTIKYLFKLDDGEFIETVLMKYHHGFSICISTQAGCKMKCNFCATGQNGFTRNLLPSEMILQIEEVQKDNKILDENGQEKNIRISNVVLMGMGEPLDNYDNVVKFLKLATDQKGLNIGQRHISVSTCGIADKIYKLADENLQVMLSLSLHAPNDELRNQLVPMNKRWNIKQNIEACKYYIKKTNRRVSFEYAMINNINDFAEHAKQLANLLKNIICYVNLIPINDISNGIYSKSSEKNIKNFVNILKKEKINVTTRRTLGADIKASCGQLKGNHKKEF